MKIKTFILALLLSYSMCKAQEATPASGGNASGSGGTVSYSVGQIVYSTHTGTNGYEVQGVQQPYEISVVIGIDEANGITLNCLAYPNPASDFVMLKVDASTVHSIQSLNYQLFDLHGKLLQKHQIDNSETKVSFINLTPATYFLKVIQGNKEIKTFKIIKN